MAKRVKMSKEDKIKALEEMQEEMAAEKLPSYGGRETLYLQPEDIVDIRFLVANGGGINERMYQTVFTHQIGDYPKQVPIRCNAATSGFQEDCPVCDLVELLNNGSPEQRKIGKSLRPQVKYWTIVAVREDEEDLNKISEPKVHYATPGLFNQIKAIGINPKIPFRTAKQEGIWLWDAARGCDFTLSRSKKDNNGRTTYNLVPIGGECPLLEDKDGNPDEEAIDDYYTRIPNLTPIMMPENGDDDSNFLDELEENRPCRMYPYDRNVKKYGLAPTQECIDDIDEIINNIIATREDRGDNSKKEESVSRLADNNEVGKRLARRR